MKNIKSEPWRKENLFFSIQNALRGVSYIFNHHYNARLIFLSAIFAILLGFYFQISRLEMLVLGFSIMLVFITEAINTTIEDIADLISKDYHQKIKIIKDVAAGVVLVAVFFSLYVGYFIFAVRIIALYK